MHHLLWERILVTVVLIFSCNRVSNGVAANATYPALFAFGDSILDTGNNNVLKTLTKCNNRPYGRDLKGIPTGRCCNGKIPTDLIAGALGIKQTVPAFLSENLGDKDLATGVSFASGGTGNDNFTADFQGVLTLFTQLQNFEAYIQRLNASVGPQQAASIISNGLYIFSSGNNDIALTYNLIKRITILFPDYADTLVELASNFLNRLYQLGARHVWVLSTLPLGCLPGVRTIEGGLSRSCSDSINEEAQIFNAKLATLVPSLKTNLPNFDVRFIDVYNPMLNIIQNPSSAGLTNVANGCCGTGTLEIGGLCNILIGSCQDPSSYFFWDAAHPTQRAYELTITVILKANNITGSFGDSPTNFTSYNYN